MRVSDIRVVPLADACELQARVESDADRRGAEWFEPFILWYRFPAWCRRFLSPDNGDPFLAALLAPAMATDDCLAIDVPVSPRLLRATSEIQAIYDCFDPRLSRIDVAATARARPMPASRRPPKTGLFFSLGVDSYYSLLKNIRDHPGDEESVTHLIAIHGFDACHGTWHGGFPPAMLERFGLVARELGKTLLPVATNLRLVSEPLASWTMSHGAGMASVALALGSMFRRVIIAASATYDTLEPWGTHPVLDPLWSSERLAFVHDGCDTDRIEKTRVVARSPLVLDTLRVCPGYGPEYNCGRCVKCLRTMIDLLVDGTLPRCRTLPDEIDPAALRAALAHGNETRHQNWQRRFDALRPEGAEAGLKAILGEALARDAAAPSGGAPAPRRRLGSRLLRRLVG